MKQYKPLCEGVYEIELMGATDESLAEISRELSLGLSLDEMKKIREYFAGKNRASTDVEMQALGQAWSEHCCYKSSKVFLKQYIIGIDAPQAILTEEDAGVVEFDAKHAYVFKMESHNHPSAVEPYGGAATGIGGILRDIVCMGAQPIALIDPLFFGPLDFAGVLPKGVKHPRYLFSGVIAGIRDYGNRVGIPTVCGMLYFNEDYVGNCVVNVGCLGIVEKKNIVRSRAKKAGDIFILVGGRTGRDGIHGVTFASAELTEVSETESRGAVQLGDPITKEPTIHAILETVEKGLLDGLKDLGGGGLSCVVGELALAGGLGAEVHMEKVPLKEGGLAPWEISVSESQERFMLVVDPKNAEAVMRIFEDWDVEATIIGTVIYDKILRIFYRGQKIFEMELEFLTAGPEYCRPYEVREKKEAGETSFKEPKNLKKIFMEILSSQNVCSRDWVIRQYDHEVRASTVIKPLQGAVGKYTHGDAAVLKPLENSFRGLALTSDVNPSYMKIDACWGACSAIDETCRNLVSVGATPHSLVDCLNFASPERPHVLGDFRETCRGLGHMASRLGIPYVSGNVSFYNESPVASIPPTPAILGVGIVPDIRKCVTVDLKENGNPLYLLGETKEELGGSEYAKVLRVPCRMVPRADADILKRRMSLLIKAINGGLVSSCHDVAEGGLAVCAAEMLLGADLGAELNLKSIGALRSDIKLFSESNTRWLVEVKKTRAKQFEKFFAKDRVYKIGTVGGRGLVVKDGNRVLIDASLGEIRNVWEKTIWKLMG